MLKIALRVTLTASFFALPSTAQFTDWSTPVNLGPAMNSAYLDSCVALSKNRLTLIFSSNRQTGNANSSDRDLYVSTRETTDAAWGEPAPLTMLNTTAWESCPALSLDEHSLYFTSTRAGGCGAEDIWVSYRQDRTDPLGWEAPVHLACENDGGVNSDARELTPSFFEDEDGRVLMYFASNRAGSAGLDIYQSEVGDDGTFGPVTQVEELNSSVADVGPTVRRDGLEVIFLSYRANPNSFDFWVATRASTADAWSEPVPVPSLGNPANGSGRIALSFNGRELYFASNRAEGYGNYDLWVATREVLGSNPTARLPRPSKAPKRASSPEKR